MFVLEHPGTNLLGLLPNAVKLIQTLNEVEILSGKIEAMTEDSQDLASVIQLSERFDSF